MKLHHRSHKIQVYVHVRQLKAILKYTLHYRYKRLYISVQNEFIVRMLFK